MNENKLNNFLSKININGIVVFALIIVFMIPHESYTSRLVDVVNIFMYVLLISLTFSFLVFAFLIIGAPKNLKLYAIKISIVDIIIYLLQLIIAYSFIHIASGNDIQDFSNNKVIVLGLLNILSMSYYAYDAFFSK